MNARNSLRVLLNYINKKWFIRTELNRIKEFEIERIIVDPKAKHLLEAYLQKDSFFISDAMILFKCYDICNKLSLNLSLLNDQQYAYELYEFCPQNDWKQKLKDEIQLFRETKSMFKLSLTLSHLRGQSLYKLEHSRDYIMFKRELKHGSKIIRKLLSEMFKENFLFDM